MHTGVIKQTWHFTPSSVLLLVHKMPDKTKTFNIYNFFVVVIYDLFVNTLPISNFILSFFFNNKFLIAKITNTEDTIY